jgi:hypothetical protein
VIRQAASTTLVSLLLLTACDASDVADTDASEPIDDVPREDARVVLDDAGVPVTPAPGEDSGASPEADAGGTVTPQIDAGAGPAPIAPLLQDGFESYPVSVPWADNSTHGAWRSLYSGYGTTSIETDGALVLSQSPLGSTRLDETHASLVVSETNVSGDFDFDVRMRTVQQLRTPAPNAWEVAWVVWHYTDEGHFYYFVPKPNGWELGKVDNSRIDPSGPACFWPSYENCRYAGAQRFLADSGSPSFPVGPWYQVRVQHRGDTMTISVDGRQVVSFTDNENPYRSGSIGLYNEDAHVHFDDVTLTVP